MQQPVVDEPRPQDLVAALRRRESGDGLDNPQQAAARYGERAALSGWTLAQCLDALLTRARASRIALTGEVLSAVSRGYMSQRAATEDARHPLSGAVARLTALHRISRAVTASLDLDGMLRTVVHVVRETMATDSCSIFLIDAPSTMLVLRASVGLNPEGVGQVVIPPGRGITGTAAMRRELLAVPDASQHPAYISDPVAGDALYTSQVSVPLALRTPSRIVGVLNIHTKQRRVFDRDELAFLQTAGDEIAIAIDNARLYNQTDAELRRNAAQLAALQRVTRLLAATLTLPDLLPLVGEQAVALTGARGVLIYQLRPPAARLEALARYAPEGSELLERLDQQARILADDVMASGVIKQSRLEDPGALEVQALPMGIGRRAAGAICLVFEATPRELPESLLLAFSDVVAMAIENAELYDEARRGYTRVTALLQEMHHRVRNNLQTVAALLSMQARHAGEGVETAPLREAVSRIQSIAAVHDVLTGQNLRDARLDVIARQVVEEARSTLVPPGQTIRFVVQPTTVRVSSRQATLLALMINEFLSNAVLHGFERRRTGRVVVRAVDEGGVATLEVSDDGAGLPPGFSLEQAGLGLQIARTLVESDLSGRLEIGPAAGRGTSVRISFRPEVPG